MARLGRYEIEREIGRGTMGVVYLARDPRLKRRVALKVWSLPQGLSEEQQAEAQRRFVREAQAAAGLAQPGIVTVFDVDRDAASEQLYIAMEHVEGHTLDRLLASEGLPPVERAVEIVSTLADALGAAHQAGIVHRDVKPANVLVRDGDGAVKLADFGVARIDSSSLTQPGTSIGSPAYMSPEQARGRELDGRSDLFSLASIFYELLTGARAFAGDEPTAVMYAVIHEPVLPPSELRAGLPPGIDAFFERALAKDAADRFPDAGAFREALARASERPAHAGTGRPETSDETRERAQQHGSDRPGLAASSQSSGPKVPGAPGSTGTPAGASTAARAAPRSASTVAVDASRETVAIGTVALDEAAQAGESSSPRATSGEALPVETSREIGTVALDEAAQAGESSSPRATSGEALPVETSREIGAVETSREIGAVETSRETVAVGTDAVHGSAAASEASGFGAASRATVAVAVSGAPIAVDENLETVAAASAEETIESGSVAVGDDPQVDDPSGAEADRGAVADVDVSRQTVAIDAGGDPVASGEPVEPPSRGRESGITRSRPRRWRRAAAVFGLLLIALIAVMIVRGALSDPAVLALEGRSNNVAGVLEITVDGDEVYERELTATPTRRLLQRIVRNQSESFEANIEVRGGRHEIVATLTEQDGDVHRDVVSLELEPGETRALSVRAGRLFGSPISIRAD